MPVDQSREYLCHGGIIEGLDGDDVQVSSESASDVVPTSSWRTHPTHQQLEGQGQYHDSKYMYMYMHVHA